MILITGATGFLGKNLVPLLAKYDRVRILARRTSNIKLFKEIPNTEVFFGDVERNIGILDALKNTALVIHAAARTMGNNYLEYYQTNVLGTRNIVRSMEQQKVKKILFLSSHAACGPSPDKRPLNELARPKPISIYGRTKLAAENIVRRSTLNYIILRPVSVFGPYDMDVLRYVKFINQGISPISGCGEKYLNVIYVEDLVRIIVQIIEYDNFNNHTYFVNDGREYKLIDILDKIASLLHKNTYRICIPKSIAMSYGLFNDIFLAPGKKIIWRDKVRELAQKYWLCSNEKIAREYKFQASFTLDQALQKTLKWYQNKGFLE